MKKTIIALTALTMSAATAKAQVLINEVMQSNIDCIMDEMNEFPDSWVELYNSGEEPVNLNSYKIGDSDKASKAYQLPNKTLGAKEFVLIYCDKEGTGMHTPFRLETGKNCELYLFQNDEIVDQLPSGMKKQPAPNIAYGRKKDAGDKWGYQLTPTPGESNCGTVTSDILGEPLFSIPGMVYAAKQNLQLELSLPEDCPEGTVIRYTTDGSEPTEASQEYTSSIAIRANKVVRAKLFCEGWLSPRATTHSYIFHESNVTLPVVSIVTNDNYFYDNKIGIYVNGTYQSGKKNYEFDWRRPINIEFFEGDEVESSMNQLCETRVQGGATRSNKIKSLALYAHKRFGEKRFAYEFFPDQRPGTTNFKSLILRNAGNDFDYLYMRDAIIQRTMVSNGVDLDWQAWRPAIIYINGKYIGIENIRERSNEDNIFTNYNELEDLDMIENWWELKEGTWDNYNAFKAFYNEPGHTMAEYEEWMDCREFMNLMIMNLFYCNLDFPGNNIVMWRPRTEGGRWRWIAKDTDFGLGLYGRSSNYNTIEWIYNHNYDPSTNWANEPEHTLLFRRLMEDPQFNAEFIDRALIYMGDFMNKKGTIEVWDPMYDLIKEEYPHHREQINAWWPNYQDEMTSARNWLNSRCNNFTNHMRQKYGLGTARNLKINNELMDSDDLQKLNVSINGIKLTKGCFDGKYYQGRTITLAAEPENGVSVEGWKIVTSSSSQDRQEEIVYDAVCTLEVPAVSNIEINAIVGTANGIINLDTHDDISEKEIDACYDMTGRRIAEHGKGIILMRTKDGKVKKILH